MITILSVLSVAPKGVAVAASRIARAAGRRVAAMVQATTHRSEIRRLLEMDDRQLKDIGLLRNDVLGALAQPIVRDPSIVLMVRSVDRRSGGLLAHPRRRGAHDVPVGTDAWIPPQAERL